VFSRAWPADGRLDAGRVGKTAVPGGKAEPRRAPMAKGEGAVLAGGPVAAGMRSGGAVSEAGDVHGSEGSAGGE
jgi:hypothetical protein